MREISLDIGRVWVMLVRAAIMLVGLGGRWVVWAFSVLYRYR